MSDETLQWWFCWPPCLLLGLGALMFRVLQGSWLAPGAAWNGFWFWAVVLPLVVAREFPVSPAALWIILVISMLVGLGATAARRHPPSATEMVAKPRSQRRGMVVLMLLAPVAALLTVKEYLAMSGVSYNSLLSISGLQASAHSLSVARYDGTTETVAIRVFVAYLYFSSLIGGFAFIHTSGAKRWATALPVVSALLVTTVTSAKAGFLFSIILWISAFAANRQRSVRRGIRMTWPDLRRLGLSAAVLVVIFVGLLIVRYGSSASGTFLATNFKIYLFGHLSVFSGWWEYSLEHGYDLQFGRRLFFGPAALVGLNERVIGAYELIHYKQYTLDSNIFTTYRAVIEDFSLPGTMFLAVIFGYISSFAYQQVLARGPTIGAIWLTFFYALLLSSHVNNMFGYTTIFGSFLLYSVFLAWPSILSGLACGMKSPASHAD